MNVIYGKYQNISIEGSTAVALGFFDGVHKGHQALISKLKQMSSSDNLKSTVFTFDNHPMSLIDSGKSPRLIMDNETKLEMLEKLGVDIAYFEVLSNDFLNIEPEDFLYKILLQKFNVKAIAAGFNFRFGRKSRGDIQMLREFGRKTGVKIYIAKPYYIDDTLVSSTTIRNYIEKGNIKYANKLLGHEYTMRGKVVHGKERGRKIGFPTVNLYPDVRMVAPVNGVYVTKVLFDGIEKTGITNIGNNPTFDNGSLTIETNILDFDGDIYDKNIVLKFYDRIRDEKRFNSPDELSSQLSRDKSFAERYFIL